MHIELIAEAKRHKRSELRARRMALSDEERGERSRAIVERMNKLPELRHSRVLHAFWPSLARGEVDTRPLLLALAQAGRKVVLPSVVASTAGPLLEHRPFTSEEELILDARGLHEPPPGVTVPAGDVDAVLVPALGANRAGYRIGYGGGFYDVFLRQVPSAVTILPLYACCLEFVLPTEQHDVPVAIIVTELETIRIA